jgi:hypothetical protein
MADRPMNRHVVITSGCDMMTLTASTRNRTVDPSQNQRKIYNGATAVPRENKDYVPIFSDDHGTPALVGDHRAPTAPAMLLDANPPLDGRQRPALFPDYDLSSRGPMVTDTIDYYGAWKLLDGLVDAVFRGTHREYALGNTAEQRFMGLWSDRVPVRELQIEEP